MHLFLHNNGVTEDDNGIDMDISNNRYVALTTFTRDGRRKSCPVWIVALPEGDIGFTTEVDSWKARRISHTPKVELIACNSRGVPIEGSTSISGYARLVTNGEFLDVQEAIRAKYGFQFLLIVALGKITNLFRRQDSASCGVVITLTT
tara:strand:+ start:154 stop:597 length:444 start_codon:yes stop_codon:yes gene_type:complete